MFDERVLVTAFSMSSTAVNIIVYMTVVATSVT